MVDKIQPYIGQNTNLNQLLNVARPIGIFRAL